MGAEGGTAGWKLAGITPEQYIAELRAYDAELTKDDYVLGGTIFTAGPTPDWESFSIDDLVLTLTTEENTPVTTVPDILPYLDSLWGIANTLDNDAVELRAKAQAIRDYVVLTKQSAGLESPKV